MEKLLTIIVAAYNVDKYLRKGLESCVLPPPWRDAMDVIVVNDGSTDKTSAIAHEFEAKYPNVFRVVDKKNGHYGSCINAGLPLAEGEYVKILDGDDALATDGILLLLQKIYELRKCPPDVIFGGSSGVDGDGNVISERLMPFLPSDSYFDFSDIPDSQIHIGHAKICYRSEVVSQHQYHQTEGCAYTDMEWYTIPMLWVKSRYYTPHIWMRVTSVRAERTMIPTTFAKGYFAVAQLTIGILRKFINEARNSEKENVDHVKRIVVSQIREVYKSSLIGICGLLANVDLTSFDDELKLLSKELYDKADIPFGVYGASMNIVRIWRRERNINCWQLRCMRGYVRFVTFFSRIRQQWM